MFQKNEKMLQGLLVLLVILVSLNVKSEVNRLDAHLVNILRVFQLEFGANQEIQLFGVNEKSDEECLVRIYNSTKINSKFPESSKSTRGLQISIYVNSHPKKISTFELSAQSLDLSYKNERRVGAALIEYKVINQDSIANALLQKELKITSLVNQHRTLVVQVKDVSRSVSFTCSINRM